MSYYLTELNSFVSEVHIFRNTNYSLLIETVNVYIKVHVIFLV